MGSSGKSQRQSNLGESPPNRPRQLDPRARTMRGREELPHPTFAQARATTRPNAGPRHARLGARWLFARCGGAYCRRRPRRSVTSPALLCPPVIRPGTADAGRRRAGHLSASQTPAGRPHRAVPHAPGAARPARHVDPAAALSSPPAAFSGPTICRHCLGRNGTCFPVSRYVAATGHRVPIALGDNHSVR